MTATLTTRPLPPAPTRRSAAGAVLHHYLAVQVDRLAAEEQRVRDDEPDAVHQMRIAARRLRATLQTYRRLLDAERTTAIVDALREFARGLAPARDAEVVAQRIATGLADLPPELVLGPARAQVTRHFSRVASEARAAALATVDSAEYGSLRRDLDELIARPPLNDRAAVPARRELATHLARGSRRVARAMAAATDPATPAADRDDAIHAVRKAGKRLRYATEAARPVVGTAHRTPLKALQKALGEHQDTVVARTALRELGALAHLAGENGFSFGILYGREVERAAAIERTLPSLWKHARP